MMEATFWTDCGDVKYSASILGRWYRRMVKMVYDTFKARISTSLCGTLQHCHKQLYNRF